MDADSLVSAPQLTTQPGAAGRARRRRAWLLVCLLALLPVSVLLAFMVLHAMASAFADPTGGCGGG
jgi:hypothetical protein